MLNAQDHDDTKEHKPVPEQESITNTPHLTSKDLAVRWSVSIGHLANCRSNGAGPDYLRLGGRVAYRLADVLAYEEQSLVRLAA